MELEKLLPMDIPNLQVLQPAGWNDIRKVFNQFIDHEFFYAVKLVKNGKLIGVGEAIILKGTSWLGNIIVHPTFQGQGIGSYITRQLIEHIKNKGVNNQYLLATEAGKPLYERLGFKHSAKYIFWKNENYHSLNPVNVVAKAIEPLTQIHLAKLEALDESATGETRGIVLKHFLDQGLFYSKNGALSGFYLPKLGDGLIIANDREAGLELLKLRLRSGQSIITIPEDHQFLNEWAEKNGFKAYRTAYKMYLGKAMSWNPEMFFSRIGGYLG